MINHELWSISITGPPPSTDFTSHYINEKTRWRPPTSERRDQRPGVRCEVWGARCNTPHLWSDLWCCDGADIWDGNTGELRLSPAGQSVMRSCNLGLSGLASLVPPALHLSPPLHWWDWSQQLIRFYSGETVTLTFPRRKDKSTFLDVSRHNV